MSASKPDLGQCSAYAVLKCRMNALLEACKERLAVLKEEDRMLKQYKPGTVNAEDAWKEFLLRKDRELAAMKAAVAAAARR